MGNVPQDEPMVWSDAELDALFAEAGTVPEPSDGLMARIMADALALQQERAAPAAPMRAPQPARGFWSGIAQAFGGAGALAGMGTAALAGLYLGFAQPAAFTALPFGLSAEAGIDSVDLMPGIDALLAGE